LALTFCKSSKAKEEYGLMEVYPKCKRSHPWALENCMDYVSTFHGPFVNLTRVFNSLALKYVLNIQKTTECVYLLKTTWAFIIQ
jgi:hypothetical protein